MLFEQGELPIVFTKLVPPLTHAMRFVNNEKVDIIRWSDDPVEFVAEALRPAKIRSTRLDEEKKVVHVTVDEEDLSKAIGRRGQNARLTAKLMRWDVQISKDESEHEQFEARVDDAAQSLAEQLGIDDDMAGKLYRGGGATKELVAQMPVSYIVQVLDVSEDVASEILKKATSEETTA